VVIFEVCRDADHASDNLVGDAYLVDFEVSAPRDAPSPGTDTIGVDALDDGADTAAARDVVHIDPADTTQFIYVTAPTGGIANGCADGTSDKVLYNETTNTWSCGTDQGGSGSAWTTIGTATADAAGDTMTITDTLSIDLTTGNDPEDLSAAFNPALAVDECVFSTDGTGGGILCEGSVTAGEATVEGLLVWAPTTADRTLTLPDATDTIVARDTTDTLTNKTLTAAANAVEADDLICTNCIDDTEVTTNAGTALSADLEEEGQINATAVTGNAADDQVILGSGASTAAYATVPDCNTEQMLTYTQATNTWGCEADDDSGGTPTQIVQLNSDMTVADAGAGTITATVDATVVGTWNVSGLTLPQELKADGGIDVVVGNAPQVLAEASSATNPTLIPDRGNPTTGLGGVGASYASLIALSDEVIRADDASGTGATYVLVTAGTTGVTPTITGAGEANTSLELNTAGTGSLDFLPGGTNGVSISSAGAMAIAGSGTITATDLQAGSEVVADAEVVDTITIDHSSTGTLTLDQTVAPTTEGVIAWDATNDELEIGETTTTAIFKQVGTFNDEQFCTAESTGNQIDCDLSGSLADDDLSDDLITALSGVTTVTDGAICEGGATSTMDCDLASTGTGNVARADSPVFTTAVTVPAGSISASEIETAPAISGANIDSFSESKDKTLFDSTNLLATDDVPDLWVFEKAVTITAAKCISTGGTSITVTIEDDAGNDLTTGCVCATTLTNCTLTGNVAYSADERADWTTVSVSGSVTSATMALYYDAD
jgi:hypothetical protein